MPAGMLCRLCTRGGRTTAKPGARHGQEAPARPTLASNHQGRQRRGQASSRLPAATCAKYDSSRFSTSSAASSVSSSSIAAASRARPGSHAEVGRARGAGSRQAAHGVAGGCSTSCNTQPAWTGRETRRNRLPPCRPRGLPGGSIGVPPSRTPAVGLPTCCAAANAAERVSEGTPSRTRVRWLPTTGGGVRCGASASPAAAATAAALSACRSRRQGRETWQHIP